MKCCVFVIYFVVISTKLLHSLVAGLEDAVKLVKGIGGKCHGYIVDLTNRDDIYRVAKKVNEEIGRVSIVRVVEVFEM